MNDLIFLRSKLHENYFSFYELIKARKLIVKKIFKLKKETPSFLPEIENNLFDDHSFKELSLKEIFSLSLLVESHASSVSNYPLWSERVHLNKASGELFEQINPIMILNFDKNLFSKLDFNDSFKFLRNYL